MPADDGRESIADEEIVYRRVSAASGWYEEGSERPVAWLAFRPNRNDVRGLSVWRAKYKTAAEAAAAGASPGKQYYVIGLHVGRLRTAGVIVEPSADEAGVGHASLANLNSDAYEREKNAVRSLAEMIAASLVESVDGPFAPVEV